MKPKGNFLDMMKIMMYLQNRTQTSVIGASVGFMVKVTVLLREF